MTNATRPVVLVLMGGPDTERPVSLRSGNAVAAALRGTDRFEVRTHEIDRPETFALDARTLLHGVDVVFPALHGRWGEGGPLQSILESLRAVYVGSAPAAAALAMDKVRTRNRLQLAGFPVPDGLPLGPDDPCPLLPPLVLKPIDDGSSINLRIVTDQAALQAARQELHPRLGTLLAERFVAGREVTAGIVHGMPLPLVEVLPANGLYDYAAKYERSDTRYSVAPKLLPRTARRCEEIARAAWSLLGLRDVARADFIVDGAGEPWFLEVNTMPGFTGQSLLPMAAARAGLPMSELCASLVTAALQRGESERTSSAEQGLSRCTFPWPEPAPDAKAHEPAPLSGD